VQRDLQGELDSILKALHDEEGSSHTPSP
jgi:hypothetical protein